MKIQLTIVLLATLVAMAYSLTPEEDNNIIDKTKLAKKYVQLIEKFGEKAWHFLECMGMDWAEHCVSPTIGCMTAKSIVGCIELIACEAKDAKSCAQKLN
ncbi:unnamed protein product [Oppiella nova]|uniref:Uncharacterized protein n=1 Tax=Oppiella nova TaxID=334625 RepID=A0A7R9MDZ3_9ACAR|nr:unnamed protein product [Oppiella nova]CAG2174624.1 unnamed protein product [Oppiella nova]